MKNLRHPNIVKLVGVCWDRKMLGCVLEYISNGSLGDLLKKDYVKLKDDSDNKLTWRGSLHKMMLDAATGVQYLHNSLLGPWT